MSADVIVKISVTVLFLLIVGVMALALFIGDDKDDNRDDYEGGPGKSGWL